MSTLWVGGPSAARELELDHEALAAAPEAHRVPDVSALAEGRAGTALRLAGLAEMVGADASARFVHVESEDGSFTANVPIEQALESGLVLYAHEGGELPREYGGPFRLLFPDDEDCSVSVKFLARVEFVEREGSHTARCAD
jgi:DMSO/TMAO reductase YedYZ molybdopterin-dependent catalytic subunit